MKPGSVGNEELLLSAIPVTSGVYWYVSAYAGLFFLIPWLNAFLRTIDNKKCSKFIFIVFAVFICYGNLSRHFNDGFYLNDGYSLIWLVFLYLIGAWMKKCDIPSRVNQKHLILGFVVSTVFSWFMKEFAGAQVFVNYISLTIVYNAFALVCVFSKMKMNSTEVKVISALAPAAFEVYLIHSQTVIWDHFMTDAFTWISGSSIWLVPFEVLGSALGIFLVCLLIKKIRQGVFRKIGINNLIQRAEEKMDLFIQKIWNRSKTVTH